MSDKENRPVCERQVIDSVKGYAPWFVPGRDRNGTQGEAQADPINPPWSVPGRDRNGTQGEAQADPINQPAHYCNHPSGVECIQITEHMGFNLGNAVKYIWRADLKGEALADLRKARWYVERELLRREGMEK